MRKVLACLVILMFCQSLFATSWHKECISEWGPTIEKALDYYQWSSPKALEKSCYFDKAQRENHWMFGNIVTVTYCCQVPNNCTIKDYADEAAMGHSEYSLSCR